MRYYPVNLDIFGRKCLVVGGGRVGTRKVKTLLECGADVIVVSPNISLSLKELNQKKNQLILKEKPYKSADMDGVFLVFATTDNKKLNAQIQKDARAQNVLCNIADAPANSHFTLPAVISQGDLILTVSTSGKSPALARKLRKNLEKNYGPEYAECLKIMGDLREKLLQKSHDPEGHKQIFRNLLDKGLIDLIKTKDRQGIIQLLDQELKDICQTDLTILFKSE